MSQMPPRPSAHRTRGPSPEKTAQTRKMILAAAMAELLDHGYAASTMNRVAERAGLAKGTPYRYFPAKEMLFLDLLRELVTDPLREMRNEPIAPDETIHAYCRRVLLPIMRLIEESGRASIARLALTECRSFPELTEAYRRDVYVPFLEYLTELTRLAVARGEIPADGAAEIPHLLSAPMWVGMIQNGILAPGMPVCIGPLFERQLECIFGGAGPA